MIDARTWLQSGGKNRKIQYGWIGNCLASLMQRGFALKVASTLRKDGGISRR
jgi:hypothetical protein